jgi:uncharacterized protein with HEPN domain
MAVPKTAALPLGDTPSSGQVGTILDFPPFLLKEKNEMAIDAVVRNFEIIGEAANNIPSEVQLANPQVPWKQMIEMRNFLIHEYFGVDLTTVWQTEHKYLPPLKDQLLHLL